MSTGVLATLSLGLITGLLGYILKWVWSRLNQDMLDLKREIKRLDEEDRKLKSEITCGQIQTVRIEASLVSLGEKLDRLGNEFSGLRGDIQKQLGSAAALEQVVKSFIEAHHAC